jgi:hypothetical protein
MMSSNKEFRVVLSNNSKSNNCKCINCYYDIVDIFNNYNFCNQIEEKAKKIEFREVVSENFSKGKLFS